ncbi:MAG: alpha/beta hydrolase [Blastocatellia bacterium]
MKKYIFAKNKIKQLLSIKLITLISTLLIFSAQTINAQEKLIEKIPTKFIENGKAISLEIVIFRPMGKGPFPTVVFNHGSTGRGNNPQIFTKTYTNKAVVEFFNEKGWLVVFPQRRGRGNSDGLYDEGFEKDRSQYSCSPDLSLPGVERALADIDQVVEYLKTKKDVSNDQMIIAGQSRGGILSIAYAGTRPNVFKAAINFVGGWMSDQCPNPEAINTVTFRRGANFKQPTLWLYGENDPFYSIKHSRKNFDEFIKAGGRGKIFIYSLGKNQNGHLVIEHPELWHKDVELLLKDLLLNK